MTAALLNDTYACATDVDANANGGDGGCGGGGGKEGSSATGEDEGGGGGGVTDARWRRRLTKVAVAAATRVYADFVAHPHNHNYQRHRQDVAVDVNGDEYGYNATVGGAAYEKRLRRQALPYLQIDPHFGRRDDDDDDDDDGDDCDNGDADDDNQKGGSGDVIAHAVLRRRTLRLAPAAAVYAFVKCAHILADAAAAAVDADASSSSSSLAWSQKTRIDKSPHTLPRRVYETRILRATRALAVATQAVGSVRSLVAFSCSFSAICVRNSHVQLYTLTIILHIYNFTHYQYRR
jgi:hypothetical protein